MDFPNIHPDRDNPRHPPHTDVTFPIPGISGDEGLPGAEQIRITDDGTVIGGTTNIKGGGKLDWE